MISVFQANTPLSQIVAMTDTSHLTVLACTWIAYAVIHSVLASNRLRRSFEQRFPDLIDVYRLLYNLIALILLLPPLWLLYSYTGRPLWDWSATTGWLMNTAALLAVAGFVFSLRAYDSREFLGLSGLKQGTRPTGKSCMSLCWEHRFVRHPWYFYGLVIIWSREMNAAWLVTAITLTLYLVAGSWLEEKKLVATYGQQYTAYQRKVPGLIPRPWRILSREEARQILDMQR